MTLVSLQRAVSERTVYQCEFFIITKFNISNSTTLIVNGFLAIGIPQSIDLGLRLMIIMKVVVRILVRTPVTKVTL